MNEPVRSSETPALRALPQEASALEIEPSESFDGGGGPPPANAKSSAGFWILFFFGLLLILVSSFALSKDPATANHYHHPLSFGEVRVSLELAVFAIGCGCLCTSLALLRTYFVARIVEYKTGGKVKSIRSKRLEKVSDEDIFAVIARYVGELFKVI
jgi:hypothetical protein